MKKLLIFLLLTAFVFCLVPMVSAAEAPMTGVCGENMTYTLDMNTKTLTITGTGEMDDFGQSGEFMIHHAGASEWHLYHDQIETIRIGEGVTTVGNQAFLNFSALTCVELPESLTKIGSSAFAGCVKLPEIRLPSNLQHLGGHAFYQCENLKTLTIPAAMTAFNPKAVTLCAGLAAFDVAEGNSAFAVRDGILFSKDGSVLVCYPQGKGGDSYAVPEEVKEIGDAAFQFAKIKNISLPDGLTKLGDGAFARSGLTEFTLPKTISAVPDTLLHGCAALEKVTLHEGVTAIGEGAFFECAALTVIDLPAGLRRIDNYAFCFCTALRNATLPEGLTELGYNSFSRTAISAVTIPAAITVLDNGLFSFCENLSEVKLHDGITSLGSDLFFGCTALEHVSLPESVTEIKSWCFAGSGLKEFTFPKGVTQAEYGIFEDCGALKNVDCPGIENVGSYAFHNCAALETVAFGSSLKRIAGGAFTGCASLRDLYYDADTAHWNAVSVGTDGYNDPIYRVVVHTTDGTTTIEGPTKLNPFNDVEEGNYYYDAVMWAVNADPQVTSGTSTTTFSPDDACTRAQVVTFLWRAKGCPEPTKTENPFKDVKETDYFCKAVLWAVENGITNGVAADSFAPDDACTRGQVATFLWRAEGKPDPTKTENPFKDVKEGDYFYKAVLWAAEKEITKGTAADAFSPPAICTRGQIVTFLYRDLG